MLLIRNKLGFPTQFLGKKMQVASPMVILHIKLLKHFPIQNGRDSGSSSMCSSNCCAPAHMDFRDLSICHENPCILQPSHLFPRFHFPFWSTQLPVLIAVSIFGPKPSYIVEPGYVWQVQSHAKPLSFKSRSSQIFMAPRKLNKFQNGTAHRPKWKFLRAGNVLWRNE